MKPVNTKGLKQEILYNGRLVISTLSDANRETIDANVESGIANIKAWDSPLSLNFLHDLSHKDVSLTPYFRDRLGEVARTLRQANKPINSAIVLQNTIMSRLFIIFGETFTRQSGVKQRFFVHKEHALAWLMTFIEAQK